MRRVRTTIENTDETVTKSIASIVIDKFTNLFKLGKVAKHITVNQKDFSKTKFNIGDIQLGEQHQNIKVLVNITETLDTKHVAVTRVRNNNTKQLISDNFPDLRVNTLYVPSVIELNLSFFSKSQTQLENMASTLRMLHIKDGKATLLSIFYRFYATPYLGKLLTNINNNYNKTHETDRKIYTYLKTIMSDQFTMLSNVTGTEGNLGFQQHVKGVLGQFTSDILNNSLEYNKETGNWHLSFDFTVHYEKPLYMDIMHDISAHNIPLDNYFMESVRYKLADVKPFTSEDGDIHETDLTIKKYLEENHKSFYTKYVTIPEFDTRPDLEPTSDMLRLMTVFTTLDGNVDNILFNMDDLSEVSLRKEIVDYIKETEHAFVTTKYQSIFYFQLFANRRSVKDGMIKVTPDGNILTNVKLKYDFIYRVSISIITDLSLLPKTAIDRINKYPKILELVKTLLKFNYSDVNNGDVKISKDMIQEKGITLVPIDVSSGTIMKTVQVSHIVANLLERKR